MVMERTPGVILLSFKPSYRPLRQNALGAEGMNLSLPVGHKRSPAWIPQIACKRRSKHMVDELSRASVGGPRLATTDFPFSVGGARKEENLANAAHLALPVYDLAVDRMGSHGL